MQVGDLVMCNCESSIWYKGLTGILVYFDHFGRVSKEKGDPVVMYEGGTCIRLARSGLSVVS